MAWKWLAVGALKEYHSVICFDGCVNENKSIVRNGLGDDGKLLEFVLIFQRRVREGRQRKIFCGSLKVETAMLKVETASMKLFVTRARFSELQCQGAGQSSRRHWPMAPPRRPRKEPVSRATTHYLTCISVLG